ncbi:hypothetical protein IT408_03830 [Candidatus Uhrbacteria bacterium]|nr:hypothetical protein [Candidatus Uhrbacteria bacterium]
MRQALLRFRAALKQRLFIPKDKIESRLGIISAVFGTSFVCWLIPFIVRAMIIADSTGAGGASGGTTPASGSTGASGAAAPSAPAAAAAPSASSGDGGGILTSPLADGASYIFNLLGTMIATVLYLVIYGLIFVNTLITDLVIRVAQYNNFVNAKPVELGWPLVRDVCNMFFIVVLLLIAFSTIIGYKPFHFKDNLPKLLLYAVLINFSKTLVGILIDFSQVITLTFVVGFKDAAFGNFAKAFQVPSLLSLNTQALTNSGGGLATTSNIIVALVFGIWIMSIALTTLVIMLIYFLARIVGLWVLLILSPLAFFALGVPTKIGAVLQPVKSFWQQLSAWLTGGPVVAFFLWLALAVIQEKPSPFADVGGVGTNAEDEKAVQAVITDIGKPENMLNFIVSIAFMLFGVKTAVEVSKSANPMLGSMAGKLNSGGGVAWKAAKAVPQAPRAAAKGASFIPGSQKLARFANQQAAKGGVVGALARGSGAGAFGGMVLQEKGLREEQRRKIAAEKLDSKTRGLQAADKFDRLGGISKSGGIFDRLKKKAGFENYEPNYARARLSDLAMSKFGAKALGDDIKTRIKLPGNLPQDQRALHEKSSLAAFVLAQRKSYLDSYESVAKSTGDEDALDKIKEEKLKNPGLMSYSQMATEMPGIDPKGIKADAFGDSAVFLSYMKGKGLIGQDGKLNAGYRDSAAWKGIASGNGSAAKLVRRYAEQLEQYKGFQDSARIQMAAMHDKATPQQIAAADAERKFSAISTDGTKVSSASLPNPKSPGSVNLYSSNFSPESGSSGTIGSVQGFADLTSHLSANQKSDVAKAFGGTETSRDSRASRFSSPLSEPQVRVISNAAPAMSEAAGGRSFTPDHISQMYQAQAAGVNTGDVGLYPEDGDADAATAAAIGEMFAKAFADAISGDSDRKIQAAQFIANIDLKALRQGGGAAEKIASSLTLNISTPHGVDAFKTAYNSASGQQQKEIEVRLKEIVSTADSARGKSSADRSSYEAEAIKFQDALLESTDKALKGIASGRTVKK